MRRVTQSSVRILLALLFILLFVIPAFFALQIVLIETGRLDWVVQPNRAIALLDETPFWSRLAPFLRLPVLAVCLILLARRPGWLIYVFPLDMLLHVSGWVLILGNPAFTLPTGHISFVLQAVTLLLLLQYSRLLRRKTDAA